LKLTSTRTEDVGAMVPNRVRYYSENRDGTIGNAFPGDMSDRLGGGGWLSSAADMRAFGEALAQGKLIPTDALNRMTTAATSSDGKAIPYGLGVTPIEFDGRKAFFHTGDSLGASAILYVEGDVVIAAIWNKDSLGAARLQFAKDVAALVAAQMRK
jgi:CubicO group peptidase (beta-lactamase class C family)